MSESQVQNADLVLTFLKSRHGRADTDQLTWMLSQHHISSVELAAIRSWLHERGYISYVNGNNHFFQITSAGAEAQKLGIARYEKHLKTDAVKSRNKIMAWMIVVVVVTVVTILVTVFL